jgi:hypothetical protein
MPNQEREEFVLRGVALEAIRENLDWFVYSNVTKRYVGKVLVRSHSPRGPFIAFYGSKEIADGQPSLEGAVDAIARWIVTNPETA